MDKRDALKAYTSRVGKPLLRNLGVNSRAESVLLAGRKLRDQRLWDYPILPAAVITYIELAASREWAISGKPRAVARAVDLINNSRCVELATGRVDYGFEAFLQRRALDHIALGRTVFVKPNKRRMYLEYIDPSYLRIEYDQNDRMVMVYEDGRVFDPDELVFHHSVPIGTSNFIAPLQTLVPSATLAWLIREHDTAKLDGRKLRDIIFVANADMIESVEQAIQQMAALWSGVDPSQVGGVPLVEINNPSGAPLSNYIYRLGLSEIPESFDRKQFTDEFVNQIAGTLGLALRHFWNNEKTTNRALEEVQEARQQQKGPAMFVRTEQRLYNYRGVLDDVFPNASLRFAFIEETDTNSQLTHARVLYNTVLAMEKIQKVFGASIDLEAYLAWMQSIHMLPNDLRLVTSNPQSDLHTSDLSLYQEDAEIQATTDLRPPATGLKYDEVMLDRDGRVLDRRLKVFKVADLVKPQTVELPSDEEAFLQGARARASEINLLILNTYLPSLRAKHPDLATLLEQNLPVDDQQQAVLDEFYREVVDGEENLSIINSQH